MDATPLQRALSNAPERSSEAQAHAEQRFFCFELGELRLGVRAEHVREVFNFVPVTPLPRSPGFLLGVCGHRGEILPVIDLLRFFGKGESRGTARTRLFVVNVGVLRVSVLADRVAGIESIPAAEILPAPGLGEGGQEHLLGVRLGEDGAPLVHLIDIGSILELAHQKVVTR